MRAVLVENVGGPEVLTYKDVADPVTHSGEVLVKVEAIGVNYIDTYYRRGIYQTPLPFIPGFEGSGTVIDGSDSRFNPGDKVAWCGQIGSYADKIAVHSDRLVYLPPFIDFNIAASIMLQGLTAEYLTTSSYKVNSGDWVLVHAASGGAGRLITQMCLYYGAKVIATVSTEEKAQSVRDLGVEHIIKYRDPSNPHAVNFLDAVKEITKGVGVEVVYDGVGASTFNQSLASLKPRGSLVVFGQSSGVVPPVDLGEINRAGSIFLSRPALKDFTATSEELTQRSEVLFNLIDQGVVTPHISNRYALSDATKAHTDLESGITQGSLVLLP